MTDALPPDPQSIAQAVAAAQSAAERPENGSARSSVAGGPPDAHDMPPDPQEAVRSVAAAQAAEDGKRAGGTHGDSDPVSVAVDSVNMRGGSIEESVTQPADKGINELGAAAGVEQPTGQQDLKA